MLLVRGRRRNSSGRESGLVSRCGFLMRLTTIGSKLSNSGPTCASAKNEAEEKARLRMRDERILKRK